MKRFVFLIPFRDLAPLVDDWRERTCASKPSHGSPARHAAHSCSARPGRGCRGAADFSAFEVTFGALARFPGTLWLAPEPKERFVAMAEALARRFPDYLPYSGLFETVTPHLTVAQDASFDDAETVLQERYRSGLGRPLSSCWSKSRQIVGAKPKNASSET